MRLLTRRVFRQEKRVRRGSARSIRSPGRRDGNAFFRSENTLFPAWESTLDVANIFPNFPIAQPFCIHTGGKPSSVRQPYISYRPRIYRISVGPLLVHPILRELCNFSTNGIIIFFVFFCFSQIHPDKGTSRRVQSIGNGERRGIGQHAEQSHAQRQHWARGTPQDHRGRLG